ncbi:DNA-processing protein DprA [Chromobacterium sp. IIBBL 290-4]|uniref:DNA-processing protein DprA n=1 Tax=Chromobacterium sp. IIBBL 290-4 TaxID=2953890 RepID=UPI0020B76484|nr:DNA-processing protein DprA [Chromobacterium sp. IIBBL 290-4]UTH75490.1 DNA-processing protein DprA [Chromobacterium sp. IIBBL 290-4]
MTASSSWLQLTLTPGIGPVGFLKLIQAFGSAEAAAGARAAQTEKLIGREAAEALQNQAAAEAVSAAEAWAQGEGCHLITLLDDDYPPQLAESDTPPPLLFGRGRRELLSQPMLAVVGSRAATPQGKRNAEDFASALAAHGYTIVSGLASGIDAAAHQGALAHPASTIAVIGTGIDRVYPASNRQLAHRIAAEGLILSEFPLGMGPLAGHFPRRNRIIAGLARGCLVVEASTASGSLITARLAMESNRDVMAIPGSIHNAQARGCHRLIKDGARLAETVDDVLDEIGRLPSGIAPEPSAVAETASPLLAGMGWEPVLAESLAGTLGLTPGEVYAMLLELELSGQVASLPGGRFQRLAQP